MSFPLWLGMVGVVMLWRAIQQRREGRVWSDGALVGGDVMALLASRVLTPPPRALLILGIGACRSGVVIHFRIFSPKRQRAL
jgi:hypothetical protein